MTREISPLKAITLCLFGALAIVALVTYCLPQRYVATARVLLPAYAASGSRVVKIERTEWDAARAAEKVRHELAGWSGATVIDEASVRPLQRNNSLILGLGAAGGLAAGAALAFMQLRRRRPVSTERDLAASLGDALLAARPLQADAVRGLATQLLEHWFNGERTVLPVVSAERGAGRTAAVAALANALAGLGVRTLVVDADLRSPGQHRAFQLPNRRGLADFLREKPVQLAARSENLAVLVAGTPRGDPVELLSRARLSAFLEAAGKPFYAILVDTPAAESGPDLQIFAALAGGALVVARRGRTEAAALAGLRAQLDKCSAKVVATLMNPD